MKFVTIFVTYITCINIVFSIKIAIIGGGIAGTSCALFLKDLSKIGGYEIQVEILEKNQIGGRLASVEHNGNFYEIGASVLRAEDKYINSLVNKYKMNVNKIGTGMLYAIYENQILESTGTLALVKQVKSMYQINSFTSGKKAEFNGIYEKQEKGQSFKTVNLMLESLLGSTSTELTSKTLEECLKITKVSDPILRACNVYMRILYGQNIDILALPGLVTLKRLGSQKFDIQGGNQKLAEKCFTESGAKIFKARVTEINRLKNNRSSVVSFNEINGKVIKKTKSYDIVIVATPLAENLKNNITFSNYEGIKTKRTLKHGKFLKKVITILEGKLKSNFFGTYGKLAEDQKRIVFLDNTELDYMTKLESEKSIWIGIPSTALKKGTNFLRSSTSKGSSASDEKNISLWKIQSNEKLSNEKLEKIFQVAKVISQSEWFAYPDYTINNLSDYNRFVLHNNLLYINCIEWAASSVEMSIIGAKNVALLIHDVLKDKNNMPVTP